MNRCKAEKIFCMSILSKSYTPFSTQNGDLSRQIFDFRGRLYGLTHCVSFISTRQKQKPFWIGSLSFIELRIYSA